MTYNIFLNMLILSIAKIYYLLLKQLLFYNFFAMNSQKFHLTASDAFWA